MVLNKSNLEKTIGYSWHLAAVVSITVALIIVLSDVLAVLVYEVAKASTFPQLLTPVALKLIIITTFYWCIFLLCYPVTRVFRLNPKAMSFTLGVLIIISYRLYSIYSQMSFGSFPVDLSGLVVLSWAVGTVAISVAGTYFWAKFLCRSHKGFSVGAICLAIPFILAETIVALWLAKYMFEPLLHQRALLKSKLFSMPSLVTCLGYLFSMVGVVFIFVRSRHTNIPKRLLQGFTLLIFIISASIIVRNLGRPEIPLPDEGIKHSQRHVFLIVVDTLRTDALSCYGGTRISTPNIDHFAKDCILFENAYAPGPWTSPSMASIMTGLSVMVHKTVGARATVPDELQTLAERMKKTGYLTWAIGKNIVLRRRNFEQGFTGFDMYPRRTDQSLCGIILTKLFPKHFSGDASTEDLTDKAINWLNVCSDQGFLLWLHYYDPHIPYEPPEQFLPARQPSPKIGKRFGDIVNVRAGFLMFSAEEKDWIRTLYDSEVRYVDENIGRLLNHLKKLNIYDDALIILTSDHGDEFWEHNGFEHGHTLYNELIRVPLMIKLPGVTTGGRITHMVSLVSVMPTILDLCNIEYNPEYLSSRSLQPLWTRQINEQIPVVSTGPKLYEDKVAVIFDRMKYILAPLSGREELYDLSQDPMEKISLAASDKVSLQKGRYLLQEHNKTAQALRMHYMVEDKQVYLDKNTMEQLKTLGYVK